MSYGDWTHGQVALFSLVNGFISVVPTSHMSSELREILNLLTQVESDAVFVVLYFLKNTFRRFGKPRMIHT